jgi:hypothetical protein
LPGQILLDILVNIFFINPLALRSFLSGAFLIGAGSAGTIPAILAFVSSLIQ